jgi:SpoVK/Ycf46/Vps4 family AAA+-type ATPase
MDGVKNNKGFLILANTNRKDMLDAAIAQRFRKLIYIPLPEEKDRRLLFDKKTSDIEEVYREQINYDRLAEISEGLSGRDITYICDDFKRELAKYKAGLNGDFEMQNTFEDLIYDRISSASEN